MMIALLGLGLLLMMSGKKGAKSSAAPPVEVEVPVSAEETAAAAQAAAQASASAPADTPASVTAEADDPADATSQRPQVSKTEVTIGPATILPEGKAYGINPPPGPELAKKSAQATADHVRTKGAKYDRPRLAVWQAAAGLTPDGLYGPATVNALKKFGAKNVVGPVFAGKGKKR